MKLALCHRWNLTPKQARAMQEKLRAKVRVIGYHRTPKLIAGCDHAYAGDGKTLVAGIVVLKFPSLEIVEKVYAKGPVTFPYVPGLLSFREGPMLLKAFAKLKHKPDVVVFDGQGIAHPRHFGLASHMGVCLGLPSIGCAKSRLVGTHKRLAAKRGSHTPLEYKGVIVGEVLRTRTGVKPLYVSVGHRIHLTDSRELLLAMAPKFRIPEPTRQAHIFVGSLMR